MSSTTSTDSTTAPTSTPSPLNCHPSVWQRLNAIVDRRQNAKSRERDLVKHRRKVEGDLSECGATPSKRRTQLAEDHWDTECAIESERATIQTLADLLESSIKEGRTGKLFEKPEDLDEEIAAAKSEDEPELLKHARKEREEKKSQAGQILKIADHPSGELIVGRTYRFTAKTDAAIHCLGLVQGFEEIREGDNKGQHTVWVQASDFSEAFPKNKQDEPRQKILPSSVIWVEVKGVGKGKGKGDKGEGKAEEAKAAENTDGTGVFTFPGTFVLTPERHGAPVQRMIATTGDLLFSHVAGRMGLDKKDFGTLVIDEKKGEVYLSGKRVAKVHQVADDESVPTAEEGGEPATAEPARGKKKPEVPQDLGPINTAGPAVPPSSKIARWVNDQPIEVDERYRFVVRKDKSAWLIGTVQALDDADQARVQIEAISPTFPMAGGGTESRCVLDLTALKWERHAEPVAPAAKPAPAKKLEEVNDKHGRPKKGAKPAAV